MDVALAVSEAVASRADLDAVSLHSVHNHFNNSQSASRENSVALAEGDSVASRTALDAVSLLAMVIMHLDNSL